MQPQSSWIIHVYVRDCAKNISENLHHHTDRYILWWALAVWGQTQREQMLSPEQPLAYNKNTWTEKKHVWTYSFQMFWAHAGQSTVLDSCVLKKHNKKKNYLA